MRLGVPVLLGLVLWLARAPILTGMSRSLVVADPLTRSDFIYVLNGGVHNRPFQAARLYHQGLAPLIVIPRVEDSPAVELGIYPNETEVAASILQRLGVPNTAIRILDVPGGIASTLDEAVVLRRYVAGTDVRQVILVTSSIHTRRSRWTFDQAVRGSDLRILVSPARETRYSSEDWWKSEIGVVSHAYEFVALAYYILTRRGGAIPLQVEGA